MKSGQDALLNSRGPALLTSLQSSLSSVAVAGQGGRAGGPMLTPVVTCVLLRDLPAGEPGLSTWLQERIAG